MVYLTLPQVDLVLLGGKDYALSYFCVLSAIHGACLQSVLTEQRRKAKTGLGVYLGNKLRMDDSELPITSFPCSTVVPVVRNRTQ